MVEYLVCSLVQGSCMVTCFECDNDRSKIDDRSLNSPINRFRFGSRFSSLVSNGTGTSRGDCFMKISPQSLVLYLFLRLKRNLHETVCK